jgi:DNA-binding NarL/FixJ family response regulator
MAAATSFVAPSGVAQRRRSAHNLTSAHASRHGALSFTVPPVTVLIAEDFAPFREFVCRELQRRPGFQLVTVADGWTAVQQAEELRPAVILLDIGLPDVDGLTAARHIRSRCQESRIVFLTQESSADVVHEALALGACGFIEKTRARYVLPTVEAILDNPSIDSEPSGAYAGAHRRHHVQFSRDDSALLDGIERFVGTALAAGDPAIVFGTRPHWQAVIDRLCRRGVTVDHAVARGTLAHFDAEEIVSHVRSKGVEYCAPLFRRAIESAVCTMTHTGQRVAVVGEVVSLLSASGRVDAAVELERAGNEMLRTLPIEIMCAYPLLPLERGTEFRNVCAQHTAVAIC